MESKILQDKKKMFDEVKEVIEKYIMYLDNTTRGQSSEEQTIDGIIMIAGKCLLNSDYLNHCYSALVDMNNMEIHDSPNLSKTFVSPTTGLS